MECEEHTVADTSKDVTEQPPIFRDACFRQKRKKKKLRLVEPLVLDAPVADTHAHLDMMDDPALELARAAVHGVRFIVAMQDCSENWQRTFCELPHWQAQADQILGEVIDQSIAVYEAAEDVWSNQAAQDLRVHLRLLCDNTTSRQSLLPKVRLAIGCHPHNASSYDDAMEEMLVGALKDERVCAIGEVGLDYYYDHSPRDVQQEVFRRQIRLAHQTQLPLILHLREAHDDAYAIMQEEGFPAAGVLLHCFNLGREILAPWVEKGCYISIGGPVTFKSFDYLREALRLVPRTRLLSETDAPFMTPEPMRGMTCTPAHTIYSADRIAREYLVGKSTEEIKALLQDMFDNAQRLLDQPPTQWQSA